LARKTIEGKEMTDIVQRPDNLIFWASIVVGEKFYGAVIVRADSQLAAMQYIKTLLPPEAKDGEIMAWDSTHVPEIHDEIVKWGEGKIFDPRGDENYSRIGDVAEELQHKVVGASIVAHLDCGGHHEGS
jgi:hypothetical protein